MSGELDERFDNIDADIAIAKAQMAAARPKNFEWLAGDDTADYSYAAAVMVYAQLETLCEAVGGKKRDAWLCFLREAMQECINHAATQGEAD